jgi:hypothetical protein
MIYGWLARLAWPIALGGAIFALGISVGVNLGKSDYRRQLERLAAEKEKQADAVDKIVTKYVDRIVTREVIKYVPNPDDCSHASGAFRLFFDSTALDKGLPKAAPHTDAAPVPFADIADTIAANHAICHNNADKLRALQEWAAEVSK